jgi:threonine dehydrogenase-like Zn-dependent dehydrogenase
MTAVRACVFPAPGAVEIRAFPRPTPSAGEVLMRVELSEVCGTDVHLLHGQLAGVPYPLIPGHFAVGRVEETSGPVHDFSGQILRPGDLIAYMDVWGTCGACWHCLVAKASTRCPHRRVYGITLGAEDGLHGGWAEMMLLRAGTHIVRLEGMSAETYMGAGCGLVTALHAVERANIQFGDTVVVQGAGPVGLNAALLAQWRGATRVIVVGAPENRLELALGLGAETISIETADAPGRLEAVLDATAGRGADVVIEATGIPAAVAEGAAMARDGGAYVVVGQYTDAGDVTLNPHWSITRKHLDIRGCWGSDMGHFVRALALLARYGDTVRWDRWITRRYSLEDAEEALDAVTAGRVIKAAIAP